MASRGFGAEPGPLLRRSAADAAEGSAAAAGAGRGTAVSSTRGADGSCGTRRASTADPRVEAHRRHRRTPSIQPTTNMHSPKVAASSLRRPVVHHPAV